MQPPTPDCRRDNHRIASTMTIRFSINGGPEQTSKTINLTERSLAIKAAADVQKGDLVIARIDQLPAIQGEVIRVWDEGFAITLARGSCALVALAHSCSECNSRESKQRLNLPFERCRIAGVISPLVGEENMSFRLVSFASANKSSWSNQITILKSPKTDVNFVRSVWLSIGDARWIARILRTRSRGDLIYITTAINGWQLQMAATHGLSISVILNDLTEWKAMAPATYLDDHWRQLSSEYPIRNLASKIDPRQRQVS